MLHPHHALIYVMVIISAADREMTDHEMMMIGSIVRQLPLFKEFPIENLPKVAAECAQLLSGKSKINQVLQSIKQSIPPAIRETAYVIACDIAAADGQVSNEEARTLELLRTRLKIDQLISSAIERTAKARYMPMPKIKDQ